MNSPYWQCLHVRCGSKQALQSISDSIRSAQEANTLWCGLRLYHTPLLACNGDLYFDAYLGKPDLEELQRLGATFVSQMKGRAACEVGNGNRHKYKEKVLHNGKPST
jgi:hypothetical protein